jgi:hypothetical protein
LELGSLRELLKVVENLQLSLGGRLLIYLPAQLNQPLVLQQLFGTVSSVDVFNETASNEVFCILAHFVEGWFSQISLLVDDELLDFNLIAAREWVLT